MHRMIQQQNSLRLHEETVDALAERLFNSGRYESIDKHVEYSRERVLGELDVQTTSFINQQYFHHYYEVKSRDTPAARKKAKIQFRRYQFNNPLKNVKGIYVTPTRVMRLR